MLYTGTFLDGEPIINLPPKTIELKKVDFTMEERDFYTTLEAESRAQFAVCLFIFISIWYIFLLHCADGKTHMAVLLLFFATIG